MVDLEGEVGALPAVDLAAPGVLGLLDGDSSLGNGDDDGSGDDEDEAAQEEEELDPAELGGVARLEVLDDPGDRAGHAGEDARGDDEGDAVADAEAVDLLAQPHQEDGAGGEGGDRHDPPDGVRGPGGVDHVLGADEDEPADGLDDAEADGGVAGVFLDLLLPGGAFFFEFLEGLEDGPEDLEDDSGGDVGHDAQAEDGGLAERAP